MLERRHIQPEELFNGLCRRSNRIGDVDGEVTTVVLFQPHVLDAASAERPRDAIPLGADVEIQPDGEPVARGRDHLRAVLQADPGHFAIQGQDHCVQDCALAGSCGPRNRKTVKLTQIQFLLVLKAGKPVDAQVNRTHGSVLHP
ncbi:MAG: hypothetical protein ABI672_09110 [Vicinamibacteria bacterium]